MREVSRIIADHEEVGPYLELTVQEMIAINRDARTHELRKKAMLTRWKQKNAWNATYRTLLEALLKCDRAGDAQKVCKLAQSKCCWIVCREMTVHANTVVWIAGVHTKQLGGHSAALTTPTLTHDSATSTDGKQQGMYLAPFI